MEQDAKELVDFLELDSITQMQLDNYSIPCQLPSAKADGLVSN